MTSYNREKYIKVAIDSVLAQTYQNWELIVLDDCSKDNTFSIAEDYATQDTRVKAYRNDINLGQFKNRNKVAELAQGEYLKYLDSDDLLYPFALEQLVFYMEKFPEAGYGLCSIEQDAEKIFPIVLSPSEAYTTHYIKKKRIFNKAPLSSIIRKDAFKEVGSFPHEAVSGDFAMWNRMSQVNAVVLMPIGIVWYRVHSEQEMQKARDSVMVEFEYFKVAEHYIKSDKCPLSTMDKEKVLKEIALNKIKYIIWKTRTLGLGVGLKLLKYWKESFTLKSIN